MRVSYLNGFDARKVQVLAQVLIVRRRRSAGARPGWLAGPRLPELQLVKTPIDLLFLQELLVRAEFPHFSVEIGGASCRERV